MIVSYLQRKIQIIKMKAGKGFFIKRVLPAKAFSAAKPKTVHRKGLGADLPAGVLKFLFFTAVRVALQDAGNDVPAAGIPPASGRVGLSTAADNSEQSDGRITENFCDDFAPIQAVKKQIFVAKTDECVAAFFYAFVISSANSPTAGAVVNHDDFVRHTDGPADALTDIGEEFGPVRTNYDRNHSLLFIFDAHCVVAKQLVKSKNIGKSVVQRYGCDAYYIGLAPIGNEAVFGQKIKQFPAVSPADYQ